MLARVYRFSAFSILTLALSSSITASETLNLEFNAVVDRIIAPGKLTLPIDVAEGVEITGSVALVETKRNSGSINGGVFWQNTVKAMVFGEPLNAKFEGVYLGLNESAEQLTISYEANKCAAQPVLECSVEGGQLSVKDADQADSIYSPIEYLLIQPGVKDADIEFSEAVNQLVEGISNEETKIIIKMAGVDDSSSVIRVVLKLTEMQFAKP
jgi:hypothetical protein